MHPFLITPANVFGIPVCRLGLASYGQSSITPDDVAYALERGINFLNWQGFAEGPTNGDAFTSAVAALGNARRQVVVCAQFGARTTTEAATELRSALAALGTDYIDVLTIYYVEQLEDWEAVRSPCGVLRYLRDAQQDGIVRQIGITSHQRPLAAQMAATGLLDVIMIRYNAAHRGAEQEIFPTVQTLGMPLIAYTALRWGALLRSTPIDPSEFSVPRAPDWYRFVLQHPAVSVTLAAPRTRAELDEDLLVLNASEPLSDTQYSQLAAHGERVRRHAGTFE